MYPNSMGSHSLDSYACTTDSASIFIFKRAAATSEFELDNTGSIDANGGGFRLSLVSTKVIAITAVYSAVFRAA